MKSEKLNLVDQAIIATKLPGELQKGRATEILRLVFEIPRCGSIDDFATFLLEDSPALIQANLLHAVLNNIDPTALMVMALFPSGAIRTIGEVSRVLDCTVWMNPLDYWCLLDPDNDTSPEMVSRKTLSGELFIFAVRID